MVVQLLLKFLLSMDWYFLFVSLCFVYFHHEFAHFSLAIILLECKKSVGCFVFVFCPPTLPVQSGRTNFLSIYKSIISFLFLDISFSFTSTHMPFLHLCTYGLIKASCHAHFMASSKHWSNSTVVWAGSSCLNVKLIV